jgi:hypothetical protein
MNKNFFGFTGTGRGQWQIWRGGRGSTEDLTTRRRARRVAECTGRGGGGVCFEKSFTGRGEAGWRILRDGPRGASKFHAPHISGSYPNLSAEFWKFREWSNVIFQSLWSQTASKCIFLRTKKNTSMLLIQEINYSSYKSVFYN